MEPETTATIDIPANFGAAALGEPTIPELPHCEAVAAPAHEMALDGPGDFEIFYTENVPSEMQMPYIMMMATDCISGFSVKEIHPYSVFMTNRKLAGGGWVRKMNAKKDLVVQELKRRDQLAKPNKSNRGVEEIVRLFKPITDQRDIDFVVKKEGEFREKMLRVLEEQESKRVAQRVSPKRQRVDGDETKSVGGNIEGGSEHLQSNGSLTMYAAEKMMEAAKQTALSYRWKVFIAIADVNGNPMIVKRVDDAFPASFEIALGKAKAASQLGKNTGRLEDYHDISYGGLAIVIDNVCCGGIGVSGERPAKFELIADAGIDALKDMAAANQESDGGNVMDV